jgi:hypothetical protein
MEATAAASRDDDKALGRALLDGVHPNSRGKHGQTVSTGVVVTKPQTMFALQLLHRASRLGSWRCVRLLLESGAEPRLSDMDGKTVLHDACWSVKPQFETVYLLLCRVSGATSSF